MGDLKIALDMMANMTPKQLEDMKSMMMVGPEKFNEAMGINNELYGQYRTREQTLHHHASGLARYKLVCSMKGSLAKNSHPTTQRKPTDTSTIRASELLPIHVKCLQSGTTHRGRLFRGQLIVDPISMVSVQSVIEDELGDVSTISFYNIGPMQNDEGKVMEVFKPGTKVVICEPFFKLMRDGNFGIRVDNFKDVIFVEKIGPFAGDDMNAWKDEGKRHFGEKQFSEATRCFQTALSKYDSNVSAVLCNISAAYRCFSDYWSALQYAVAAANICPSNFKAKYRIAEALEALEMKDLALFYCQEAADLVDDATVCEEMQNRLLQLNIAQENHKQIYPPIQMLIMLVHQCKFDDVEIVSPSIVDPSKSYNACLVECKLAGNQSYKDGNFKR